MQYPPHFVIHYVRSASYNIVAQINEKQWGEMSFSNHYKFAIVMSVECTTLVSLVALVIGSAQSDDVSRELSEQSGFAIIRRRVVV
jgi:hypothetical protein